MWGDGEDALHREQKEGAMVNNHTRLPPDYPSEKLNIDEFNLDSRRGEGDFNREA